MQESLLLLVMATDVKNVEYSGLHLILGRVHVLQLLMPQSSHQDGFACTDLHHACRTAMACHPAPIMTVVVNGNCSAECLVQWSGRHV